MRNSIEVINLSKKYKMGNDAAPHPIIGFRKMNIIAFFHISVLDSLLSKLSEVNSCQNLLGSISRIWFWKSLGTSFEIANKINIRANKKIGNKYVKEDIPVIRGTNSINPAQALLEVVRINAVVIDIKIKRQMYLFNFLFKASNNAAKLKGQIIQNHAPA